MLSYDANGMALIESENAPGGVIVYYADGDEEIIHVNQYVIDLLECDSFDDFMAFTGGTFKGFVQSDDINSAENSIWGQVESKNGFDHIYYQVITKSGRKVSIDDYGRLIKRPGERPVFYVFAVEMDLASSIDWLTGLPSMDRFKYISELEAASAARHGQSMTMIVFDLMGMKVYNAQHGREGGDRLLRTFANILRKHFGSESCCRYGGDSFCVCTSSEDVNERVNRVFSEFASCGIEGVLPVMAGACAYDPEGDVALWLDRAQTACTSDSVTWESHLTWFTEEMRRAAWVRAHVLECLDQAIDERWIRPYYQPIVRSTTERVCCSEALARWFDPHFGMLAPDQFIPVLEEAGLLARLDMHMIACVVRDAADRRQRGLEPLPVSVNISLRDLGHFDLAGEIARLMDEASLSHDLLCVEFTESAATSDPDMMKAQIQALHAQGFDVWMDDFGSGYSSLNALGAFGFDLIKLDRGFLMDNALNRSTVIMDGVIRAAKRMGVMMLAEGVETADQAAMLTDMGCDLLQGYWYSKPMPLDEIVSKTAKGLLPLVEPSEERCYWNAVSLVSLSDLASNGEGQGVSETSYPEFPAGVFERRDGVWHALRLNGLFRKLLVQSHVLPEDVIGPQMAVTPISFDELFASAVERCETSGEWELIAGPLERGTGLQFYVKAVASCNHARAYVVSCIPSMLGSALGTYGDVPVGYAVFRMILSENGASATDAEYVYANELYRQWGGLPVRDLIGRSLIEVSGAAALPWLPLCYRAAIKGEAVHDVVFSHESGHWISYNIMQSPIRDHCVFAFVLADAEQHEREQIISELERTSTHDPLTGLLNRRGIDRAIDQRMEESGQAPFALVLLDVDDFKTVNDLYGHDVGDEALRKLSAELVRAFPASAVIGRNGGDEALVALFGEDAKNVDELLDALTSKKLHFELRGRRYSLSLSAGYAWFEPGVCDLKTTYTRADEALYAVKLLGKANYQRWNPQLEESPRRSMLGFTTRDLADSMPLAMLAHRSNGEILFANDGLARLLGFDSLGEMLMYADGRVQSVIHRDDVARVMRGIAELSSTHIEGEEQTLYFRVITKSDAVVQVAYRARLIESKDMGEIVYAYMVER